MSLGTSANPQWEARAEAVRDGRRIVSEGVVIERLLRG
jgi:hypothetical protein